MKLFETITKLKEVSTLNQNRKRVLKAELMQQIRLNEAKHMSVVPASSLFTNLFKPMPIIASLLVTLLLGGSASAAAETAKPGDLLYSMKVNVNEKVSAALAMNDESRAEKEAEFAGRRLDEASELAAAGSLSEQLKVDLEARFQAHADRAGKRIAKLEANGKAVEAADIASRFESSLQAHQTILDRLSGLTSSTVSSTAVLRGNLGEKLRNVMDVRSKIDADIKSTSTTPLVTFAAEGRIKAAENVIASVEKFIVGKEASLGAEATVEAKAKLALAKETLTQAEARFAADASGEAFTLAGKAHRMAQEARFAVGMKVRGMGNASSSAPLRPQATSTIELDDRMQIQNGRENDKVNFRMKDDIEEKLDSLLELGL